MKKYKILRTLAVALTLAFLVSMFSVTPVLAAEELRVRPTSGEIGDEINVYGYDFSDSSQYTLYFSDESASVGEEIDVEVVDYEILGLANVNTLNDTIDEYFDVPSRLTDGDRDVIENVHGGTYYIYATKRNYDDIEAKVQFTVESTAEITLDPDDGTVGTSVEITGVGFDSNEDIIVEYDNDDLNIESGDDDTDSDGEFECTIIIPESSAGNHTITVTGEDSYIEAVATFTVEPSITISPESGAAGTTVTVKGTGFSDNADFYVYFNDDVVADDETDNDGSLEITFLVPSMGPGKYDVEVWDEDNYNNKAYFTIATASISISPTSGQVNTNVTVSGTGFQASKQITITFNNDAVATTNSDGYGRVNASFNVPSLGGGTYTVRATDGTNSSQANFTISTNISISPETSAASPGYVGMELTISGIGLIAGGTATVTYDGAQEATAAVDASGSFSAKFNVKASVGGQHTITVTDGTNTQQFTFVMESTPPSTIYPQLPFNKSKLEDWRFDWCGDLTDLSKEVTDDSQPITYTLQIATSPDFAEGSIVRNIPNLTGSEYTIPKEEKLDPANEENPYYWRVKAIDSASNEGPWSGVGEFYVGGISWSLPTPVIIVLIVVGVIILGALAFWFGRKTAYY